MTSVHEDLGYVERPAAFKPRPAVARYEAIRDLGDEGWEAEVVQANGRRVWLFAPTREQAISRARNFASALNGAKP